MNLLEKFKEYTTKTPRRILVSAVVVALGVSAILLGLSRQDFGDATSLHRTNKAEVCLEPTPRALDSVGKTGTVELKLKSAPKAAGFQFELSFDNSVIQIDEVTLLTPPSDDLTFIPLKNIRNEEGRVVFGATTFCEEVCPNILASSPAILATLTVSAVGEGTTYLEFDSSYFLYGTEVGVDNMPVKIEAALANGQVVVGSPALP